MPYLPQLTMQRHSDSRWQALPLTVFLTVPLTAAGLPPQCDANNINLSPLAFNRIAPLWVGRIQIRYQQVSTRRH